MFNKYFEDKKFIFLFAFAMEIIAYVLFIVLEISGKFNIPDFALAPVLGLMFGPIGALAQFSATFVADVYFGHDIFTSFLDGLGLFFISVLSYKLWYSFFTKKKLGAPRFNSCYNILKFVVIMAIVSIFFEIWINILFKLFYSSMVDLYSPYDFINRFIYGFNLFDYSIIFGVIFISVFNFFKIPFYVPFKKHVLGEISSKYYIIFFALLLIYIVMDYFLNFSNFIRGVVISASMIVLIIYFINSIDVDLDFVLKDYSIIEKLILIFIFIVSLSMFFLYNDILSLTGVISFLGFNFRAISLISIFVAIIILLFLTLIHIHYVEKVLTNPINELSDAINEYVSNKKKISQTHFSLKFNDYLKEEDDISRLLKSFVSLSSNIKKNLDTITTETIEKERFETEFNVASNIQTNMLPTNFEEFCDGKGFDIYAYMSPAREVGGDFYDFFQIDEDNISFVIGDVSGKGIPATLFMVKTMHLIKNHSYFDNDLSKVFNDVNELSCQRNDGELFATSWLGKFNFKSGELSFVNAGHNPPLIRRNHGDFEYMDVRPNLVIGGMEGINYKEHNLNFNPGDMIFLYTDGITEANNDYNGFYGEDRLKEIVNKYKDEDLSKIITEIKDDVDSFCDNQNQFDDVTMLILKYKGWENNE